MKKRSSVNISSKRTNSFENSIYQILNFYKKTKPAKSEEKDFTKTLVISPTVSKLTFVVLMILIFVALSFNNYNSNSITSYSILDTVNPGVNFGIFAGLLVLVFFLTYEKKKFKTASKRWLNRFLQNQKLYHKY